MPPITKLAIASVTTATALLVGGGIAAGESPGPSSRRTALAISEIMYHPALRPDELDGEFIELHNSQPWPEDISGHRLSGAVDFEFPPDTLIPAGGFLVVAKSPTDAGVIFGIENVLGPYGGRLSNEGETLRLRNPSGAVLLEVPYTDTAPWPLAADGLGHSLVLAEPSLGESNPLAWAASNSMGGSPGTREGEDQDPLDQLVINEVSGHPALPDSGFIELLNRGQTPIDIGGSRLSVDRAASGFVIPPDTSLDSGERLVVQGQAPDLLLDGSDFLVALINPGATRVLDTIRYAPHSPGTSFGRNPDGSSNWHLLENASSGSENGPALEPAIVFNEIMFHPISDLAADEYIEICNRSADPIDLGGWQIAGGIGFTFSEGTSIPASGYLVVAKDLVRLRQNHPQLNLANSIGNYAGKLSDSGESLQLLRPAGWHFPGNPTDIPLLLVDELCYQDESRWSRWADGGGSSLELTDPNSSNDLAANWADSDESEKSSWTDVEVTAQIGSIPGLTPRSLQILLLGAGEMLVDDVELFRPGSSNRVRNGDFESSSNWVFQGNHEQSEYRDAAGGGENSRALLVRSPGRGDPHSNRIRQTILSGLSTPGQATVRARIRWLRGHPEILFRLHGNYMEAVGAAQIPVDLGSPGLRNSRWVENAAPVIRDVSHSPVLPAASEPVTVTATLSDPDGVGRVTLNYRVDISGGASGAVEMKDDGVAPDGSAGDGIFSVTIAGQSTGRIVAFHIEAVDDHQTLPAGRTFPERVPDQECLIRFGDSVAPGGFGDYRLWFTRDTLSKWTAASRVKASNQPLDITFVYNGERAIYNVDATYSGSFFNSPDYNGPTGRPCDYACRFSGDERFLGASKIILSWPGLTGEPDKSAQHEQFSYWMASQLGLPFNYRRYVSVIVNGVRRGTVMEDTQRPNSDMLRQWFPGDSDGELFKTQIRYESNDASTDPEFAATEAATLQALTENGGVGNLRTAAYRWNWAPQALGNSVNRFDSIFQLLETLDIQDDAAYTQSVRSSLDIEQWMRTFAFEHIVGNWDSYGYGNGQNMYAYKPRDDRWQLMIWDLDIGSGSSLGDGPTRSLFALTNLFFPTVNGDPEIVGRMYQHPEFVRAYWRCLEEAAHGPMLAARVSAYVDPKFDAMRASLGAAIQPPTTIKTYIGQRRNFILQQLASEVAAEFEILAPTGPAFETASSPLTIRGRAPVSVQTIRVNGVPVTPVWTDVTTWEIQIPLFEPENEYLIEGFDRFGLPVVLATASLSVAFTGAPANPNIILNEWMASNDSRLADPADGRFEDWLELFNAGDTAIDLAAHTLTDDLDVPGRWTFPADSVIGPGGYLLVWLDGDTGQQDTANGQFHANFSLSSSGESIGLFTPEGIRIDAVEFGSQVADISMGRSPNGTRNPPTSLPSATPGAANLVPFRILDWAFSSPEMLRLSWGSIPAENYVVQQSESLRPGAWIDVSAVITAASTSTTAEIMVPENLDGSYFFRVKQVVP